MNTIAKGMLKTLATRSVIAAIPVAMVTAYASNCFVPTPPRMAAYDYQPVAEITVDSGTVGVADSNLYFLTDPTLTIDPVAVAKHLDELQALGVDNIRVYVPWRFIEQTQGTYDWSSMDVIMKLAADRNMGVLAAINSTPQWVDPHNDYYPGAADPNLQIADFKNFVTAFVTKYGDDVSAYEIWNEPNFVQYSDPISAAAYTAILKAVYPAIKALDPTATVVAAGLGAGSTVPGMTENPVTFVQEMYAAGAKGYFDALAFHPYQETTMFSQGNSAAYPLQQAQAMAALMASNGDYVTGADGQPLLDAAGNPVTKKLWITEYGLPTSNVSYATQAAYIQDFLQKWSTLAFAGPSFIYTTVDTTTNTSASENSYGIYYVDPTTGQWVAKPAAQVIAEWIAAHPGQTFDPTAPTGPTNPTNPTGPTTPTNPVAALAALLQSFVQGIQMAINNIFVNTLGQVVTAITQAIQNIFAAFSPPAAMVTTAAPLAMKLASVVAPVVADSTAAVVKSSEDAATPAAASAAAEAAPAAEAAAATSTTETTPVAATTPAAATPAVTEPAAATTPAVTEPAAATTPTVTTPAAAATPAATDATSPAATAPAATAASSAAKGDGASSATSDDTSGSTSSATQPKRVHEWGSRGSSAQTTGSDATGTTSGKSGADATSGDKSGSDKSGSSDSGSSKSGSDKSGTGKTRGDKPKSDKGSDPTGANKSEPSQLHSKHRGDAGTGNAGATSAAGSDATSASGASAGTSGASGSEG